MGVVEKSILHNINYSSKYDIQYSIVYGIEISMHYLCKKIKRSNDKNELYKIDFNFRINVSSWTLFN